MGTPMDTLDLPPGLMPWHGLSSEQLAELTGVHVTTARRWMREKGAPAAICRALAVLRFGRLAALDPQWSGWIIRDGRLWSPENDDWSPGEVRAGRVASQASRAGYAELQAAERALQRRHMAEAEALGDLLAALDTVASAARRVTDSMPGVLRRDITSRSFAR